MSTPRPSTPRPRRLLLLLLLLPAAAWATPDPYPAARRLAQELAGGEHPGITSFVLGDRQRVLVRHVDAGLRDDPPDLRSATKSVTALLVGIAIDRGHLASVEVPVREHLPGYAAWFERNPAAAALRFADLLTMRSGLECDDWNPDSPGHEDRMYRRRDWVGFWLKQPTASAPGSAFTYCTGNVIALGKALAHATGKPLDEFARDALFAPLGIVDARWERWDRGREIDSGGHLRLAPDDLLRIGQMMLGRGEWQGRRVVSAAWIDAMTAARTSIPERRQEYGYLWWLDQTRDPALPRTRLHYALGNGGTLLIVLPELDRVLVFTGTRFNRPDALQPMFWLRDRLLPELAAPVPAAAN